MRKEILEFIKKEHYIRIGQEHKLIVFLFFMILIFIILPTNIARQYDKEKLTKINMVCTYPMIASCNDLEEAKDYCIQAQEIYKIKNCSVVVNNG